MKKSLVIISLLLALSPMVYGVNASAGLGYSNIPTASFSSDYIPGGGPDVEAKANSYCNAKYAEAMAKIDAGGFKVFSIEACQPQTTGTSVQGKLQTTSSGKIYFVAK